MSITVYPDVIVPNSVLAAGVRGKQIRRNVRTQAHNGQMQINVAWARTLRQYEVGFIPMLVSQWQTLEGLFEVTEGGAYGMLMSDPKDSSALATEGVLYPFDGSALTGASGFGYGYPAYRLHKRYTSAGSSRTKDRGITRPKATPVIKRAGVTVTYGTAAGNVSLDYATGLVTFVADASSAVTAVSCGTNTAVTTSAAIAGLSVGKRIYLSGLTGTVASRLNGVSHLITGVNPPSQYIFDVVSTGLSWSSGGAGYAYPQGSEALTWAGDFYVPVHFASDDIDWELVAAGPAATRLLAGPNVVLMEVRE